MTLTGLIKTIYAGLDVVSRETIGFIPNVMMDAATSSAAVDQVVRSPVVPQNSLENITPGAAPAVSGSQTIGYVDCAITASKAYPILWTGEEQLSVNGQLNQILVDQFAQGFRTLSNAVESDLAALHIYASRAYGTAATTPFGTAADMTDWSNANKILDDNGAPMAGRSMIINSSARVNLEGKQSQLFKANEAGDAGAMLRNREMRRLHGFNVGYSAEVETSTAGTASSATTDNAGYAVGATVLTLASAGTGTLVAGDVVTFAGDTNKYVIASGDADVSGGGTITLAAPGLRVAMSAATKAITVIAAAARNMFFSRNALLLAARSPAMPVGGDEATDVTTVTDPVSGLSYQVAIYKQYRQVKIEIGLAWGVKVIKPAHLGILLG